ncbi:MAG: hypothetical protein PHO49_05000, partial [Candidatus Nanoarchaeia archaeon]|nr:hypothetical protein [Candidatus Nanoarchaeia archaeon]
RKLLVIFVILSLYLLFFATGFFEKVTGFSFKAHCEDTDSGSIYVKGIVTGYTDYNAQFEETDYCSLENTKELKEYNCNLLTPNNWESELVVCEKGCKDGACIE